MKKFQIFLFILIFIGIALLLTQKTWVPRLVERIIVNEEVVSVAPLIEQSSVSLYIG